MERKAELLATMARRLLSVVMLMSSVNPLPGSRNEFVVLCLPPKLTPEL